VLGAHDHRPHFPQGIVEVENDGLYVSSHGAQSSGAVAPTAENTLR
jgi:hypothetical protein